MIRAAWTAAVGWLQRWAIYLLLGALALALVALAAQSLRLAWAQAEVSAGVAKAAKTEARADQLEANLGAQAEGVKLLKQAAQRREEDARAAQAAAEKSARQHQARAQDLLQRQPPAGVDSCSAAAALIREELGR